MSTHVDRLRRRLSDATAPADGVTGSLTLDALEWTSRWLTLAAYVAAVVLFVMAPILALSWSHQPFAGLTVEPTLVTNDAGGPGWTGRAAGIRYPMRVVRVDGLPVATPDEFDRILSGHALGDRVPIIAQLPDGNLELFPAVELIAIPKDDLMRLFWVPYLVGLAYLAIGIWIYSLRGRTRPGRALAFFCVATAIACGLLFDLSTTHFGPAFWTLAVSQLGGALISLALRFPEEWRPVGRHPWLLSIPYMISIGLGVWGIAALYVSTDPWAYVDAWGASYRFAALGTLVFLATMLYRARASSSPDVRRQARIVVFGSTLAFAPIVVWFVAPLLQMQIEFSAPMLLLPILAFPVSVGMAITRYRLWAVDQLVNRTLVYATLTALLAGMYSAMIGMSQRLFVAITGERSDAAIVMTTLIVATGITPAKSWLQTFVDRQFKDERTQHPALTTLRTEVHAFVRMTDAHQLAMRLLAEAVHDLGAGSGAISLLRDGEFQVAGTLGLWRGDTRLSLPLEVEGRRVGLLQLGPRSDGQAYVRQDLEALQPAASEVARAIGWAERAGASAPGPSA